MKEIKKNKRIAILGSGGHAKVVAEIAILNGYSLDFYDDIRPAGYRISSDWLVSGNLEKLLSEMRSGKCNEAFVAIGDGSIRADKTEILNGLRIKMPSLPHPSAIISPLAKFGSGCVFVAGSVVNPFAEIGNGCIVNTGATVDHDCVIGDYSHIAPGVNVAGSTKIGSNTWVGVGSSIKQGLIIGSNVMIGAGSTVVSNINDNSIAYGCPAKEIR